MKCEDICNPRTLNIFTDASTNNNNDKLNLKVCYGAIAMCCDRRVDSIFRVNTNSSVNNAEIKGIRAGVTLAIRYKDQFDTINLFCDSQVSVFGIRDRIMNWTCKDEILYGYAGDPIKNQEIYLEIMSLINRNNLKINFYHQKGHINLTRLDNLRKAIEVFAASNHIREKIDFSFIRYISKYNNIVDEESRSVLKSSRIDKVINPLVFTARNFYDNIKTYKELRRK